MKEAAVGIIFFNQNVLLVKRRDIPVWVLPGGGIDPGETPEISCIREVKEETGIDVSIARKVGTWLPINKLGSAAHVFECKVDTIPNRLDPQEESEEVKFFPLDQLPHTFFFVHRIWLNAALKYSPDRIYILSELTYWAAFKTILAHPIHSIRYLLLRLQH